MDALTPVEPSAGDDRRAAPARAASVGGSAMVGVALWTVVLLAGIVVWGGHQWTLQREAFGQDLSRLARTDALALALPLRNAVRLAEAIDAAPGTAPDPVADAARVEAEVNRRFVDRTQVRVAAVGADGRIAGEAPVPTQAAAQAAQAAQAARAGTLGGVVLGAAFTDGGRDWLPLWHPRAGGGWIVVALDRRLVEAGWAPSGRGRTGAVGLLGLDGLPVLADPPLAAVAGGLPAASRTAAGGDPATSWTRVPTADTEWLVGWAPTSVGQAVVVAAATSGQFADLWWRREGAAFAVAFVLVLLGGLVSLAVATGQRRAAGRLARLVRERDVARLGIEQSMDVAGASAWTVDRHGTLRFVRPLAALLAMPPGSPVVEDTLDGLLARLAPVDADRLRTAVGAALDRRLPLDEPVTVTDAGGRARHFVLKGGPVHEAEALGIVAAGVLRDMTGVVEAAGQTAATARTLDRICRRARIGAWDVDVRTMRLTMSAAAREVYGLGPDEPLAPWLAFGDSDGAHRHALHDARRRLLDSGRPYDLVLPIRVGGERRWVRSVAEGRFEDGVLVRVEGSIQDVTEVVEVRDQLQAQRLRMQAMAEAVTASSQLLLVTDLEQRVVWCNETFTRRTGYPLSEIAGQRPGPLLQRGTVPKVYREQMAARIAQRQGFSGMRLQNWTRDGRAYWIDLEVRVLHDEAGQATGFLGIQTDVSGDIEREERMRRLYQRFDQATRHARIGVFERDMATRENRWNETMYELFGLPVAEVPPPDDVVTARVLPEDVPRALPDFDRQARDTAVPRWEGSFRVRLPDGRIRWLHSEAVIERDPQGRAVRSVGTVVDLTALHDAEEQRLARAEAEARDQAKSLFLARMSHELRTPLNAVVGFAQLIRETAEPDAGIAARVQRIEQAGWHLLNLINDVLDLTKIDAGVMPIAVGDVALGPLLHECVDLSMPAADEADVTLAPAPDCAVTVRADPVRFRQVVLNLLSNAVKYNRPGGRVEIGVVSAAGRTTVSVVDDGLGMTPQQTAHLFEAFNRLGREASAIPGTGIGLAIVRSLVERMGGQVTVTSSPGRGSTFAVTVPSVEAAATVPVSAPRPHGHPAPPPLRLQLLCLEDNPVNAMVLGEAIAHLHPGWTVTLADTLPVAEAAIALSLPDLAVIDLNLGHDDGLQVLDTLRRRDPTAVERVIVLSADVASATQARCRAAGVRHFLPKPFTLEELDRTLRAALSRRTAGVEA